MSIPARPIRDGNRDVSDPAVLKAATTMGWRVYGHTAV